MPASDGACVFYGIMAGMLTALVICAVAFLWAMRVGYKMGRDSVLSKLKKD